MLKKRIIPCLDIKNGRVVKGVKFKNLKDAGDPVEQAIFYSNSGADELCFLDINASFENRNIILKKVSETAKNCFIPITVGGGVKNVSNVQDLLLAGADKVSINTAAVLDPSLIRKCSKRFGSQCIVIAVDAKKKINNKWEVFTHGGRKNSGIDVLQYALLAEKLGAGEILLTSIDRDGTKIGYDLELLRIITRSVSIPVIASGGVGNLEHLYQGLSLGGASAVLAASIFHYGNYSVYQAKKFLKKKCIPVRI